MNILHEMSQINDKHCRFCQKPPINKSSSERYKWCEKNCEYGEQYKYFSDLYLKRLEERREKRMLTKEKYLIYKEEGKSDKQIIKLAAMNNASFYALKKSWNLVGERGKPMELPKKEKIMIDENQDYKDQLEKANEEIKRLNEVIEQKTKAHETVVGASEKLVEENKKLWGEVDALQSELDEQSSKIDFTLIRELEEEIYMLRQCLKMVL